jgi:hypothetical protein
MFRGKSIARHEDMIATSSSSSGANDHESLGANQEQSPKARAFTYNMGSLSAMLQRRGGSLHNMIHLLASTRPNGMTTFQYKFVLLSQCHV